MAEVEHKAEVGVEGIEVLVEVEGVLLIALIGAKAVLMHVGIGDVGLRHVGRGDVAAFDHFVVGAEGMVEACTQSHLESGFDAEAFLAKLLTEYKKDIGRD